MKIFLSWSGQLSHSVAMLLKDWLPNVLQYIEEPFVSSEDIEKGAAWLPELLKQLSESDFGLICLTNQNVNSPWLHFEAGAIANKFQGSRIPGLLINIANTEVKPPLSQFQLTSVTKAEMLLLLKTLNKNEKEKPLTEPKLETVFEKWWGEFEIGFNDEINKSSTTAISQTKRTDTEILAEILTNTRRNQERLLAIETAIVETQGPIRQFQDIKSESEMEFLRRFVDTMARGGTTTVMRSDKDNEMYRRINRKIKNANDTNDQ